MSIQQISVFLENRAGQLAEITKVLADAGVDLRAISIAETADYGVLRMIVDQAQKAKTILLESGYIMSVTPVLAVAVPDAPGGVASVLALLAEGQIDIEDMYSLFLLFYTLSQNVVHVIFYKCLLHQLFSCRIDSFSDKNGRILEFYCVGIG
jgi:hypothetical protein